MEINKKLLAEIKWENQKNRLKLISEITDKSFFTVFREFRKIKDYYHYNSNHAIELLGNRLINFCCFNRVEPSKESIENNKFLLIKEIEQYKKFKELAQKYNWKLKV